MLAGGPVMVGKSPPLTGPEKSWLPAGAPLASMLPNPGPPLAVPVAVIVTTSPWRR